MASPADVSVVILTKNEERLIARAIASAWWAAEVVVVDSGSTDRTCEVAAALGAKVYRQEWLGWRLQHEAAEALAGHDWIFCVDADEIITPGLGAAIVAALRADPDPRDGFVLERREEFLGTLMPNMRRHSKRKSFVRLYNRRYSHYDTDLDIHEVVRCPGKLIPLEGVLLHWRNYTIGQQADTLNRNAEIEARMLVRNGRRFGRLWLVGKPFLRFLWLYVWCGNWRFGIKGYVWSMLHSGAEFLRQARAWELQSVPPATHPAPSVWTPDVEYQNKLQSAASGSPPAE
jgi:glycosyltransferase involved in cell wall biosynthesis